MFKNIIISIILFSSFIIYNDVNADSNIDFNTCQLNNAFCNVKKSDIDYNTKNKLDTILSRFYLRISDKYKSYTDSRYIYYSLMQKLKQIASNWWIYDTQYKTLYYIYDNIESEYYKVNNALITQTENQDKLQTIQLQTFLNKNKNTTTAKVEKNTFNDSFSRTKRYLEQAVYNWSNLQRKTIYCWCDYDNTKNVSTSKCWYINDGRYVSRSKKIEWEHVVPAENFWRWFKEWRDWSPECINSKWQSFKWRSCAEKVNKEYRYMQADMYNLFPAIWWLNGLRSNYQMSEIPWEKRIFWKCDFEIQSSYINNNKVTVVEPPENMKWDIARVYEYMAITYPQHFSISNKMKNLFNVWKKIDPISKNECDRYHIIKKIQKNTDIILEKPCSTL